MSKVINGQPYIYTGVYGLATNPVDINDKEEGVKLYVTLALCRTQSMFKYKNLPETIPQRSLELYIQTGGSCCIAEHEGNLYAFFGTFGGEPDVYYMPKEYIVANPALNMSRNYKIHEDCVVIPNDAMYMGLMPIFRRYATQLVENDISLQIADINSRIISLLTGNTDRDIASARQYIEDVVKGKIGIATSTPFMEGIKTQPYGEVSGKIITQLIELQQYYKASMFNDIGLNSNYNMKRETIVSSEIELNADALFPYVDNMLYCRQLAMEEVNKMFGTEIEVTLNSSWEDLADDRKIEKIIEESEALAAVQVGDIEFESSQLDDMDEQSDSDSVEDSSRLEETEEASNETDAESNENDSSEEDAQPEAETEETSEDHEEVTEEDPQVEEIKDELLDQLAEIVDDDESEDDSSRLEESEDEEESSQLESEEEDEAEKDEEESE